MIIRTIKTWTTIDTRFQFPLPSSDCGLWIMRSQIASLSIAEGGSHSFHIRIAIGDLTVWRQSWFRYLNLSVCAKIYVQKWTLIAFELHRWMKREFLSAVNLAQLRSICVNFFMSDWNPFARPFLHGSNIWIYRLSKKPYGLNVFIHRESLSSFLRKMSRHQSLQDLKK